MVSIQCPTLLCLLLFAIPSNCLDSCGHEIPPGLDLMRQGIDLDELNLRSPFNEMGGLKDLLLEYSCHQNLKWTNPHNGRIYRLPDQILVVIPRSFGSKTEKVDIYRESEDYEKSINAQVSFSANGAVYGISAKTKVSHTCSKMSEKQESLIEVSEYIGEFYAELGLPSQLQLSRKFTLALNGLSGTFEENRDKYNFVLDTFGGFYFDSAEFGGYRVLSQFVKESHTRSTTETAMQIEIKARYKFVNVGFGAEANNGNSKSDSNYIGKSITKQFGGQEKEWPEGIADKPHLFTGNLRPITDLIADERLRKEIDKAINDRYVKK